MIAITDKLFMIEVPKDASVLMLEPLNDYLEAESKLIKVNLILIEKI